MIAEVVPIARLPKSLSYFDYEVPQNLEGQIKIGQLVKIPFKGRGLSGIVTELKKRPDQMKAVLKLMIKILDVNAELDGHRLKLLWWMSDYYSVSPALILKILIPEPPLRASKFKIRSEVRPASLAVSPRDVPKIQVILKNLFSNNRQFSLLHYQSQKNKIAIYLKSVTQNLGQGKQVLILEPQITDINLIVPYFLHLFPDKTAVLHGELSKTEYWQEWKKIKDGKVSVVIGTRSAVFAPLRDLGLIIINNEEMADFKQSDQNPRYDARHAALKLSEFTGAKLLFASQSPRLEVNYGAEQGDYQLLEEMDGRPHNKISLIDMTQEIKKKNFSSLSEKLQSAIWRTLNQHQKIVLLLNRRGVSTLMLCKDCDDVFRCSNCQMPLVCHEDECNLPNKFICHRCGKEESVRLLCPNCRGTTIKYLGRGTQTVEHEVKKIFPRAKIARIDKDVKIQNTKYEIPDTEIFIGTQFFIKNYLPQVQNIGLIGIISADTLLFRPDFRSGEKTFAWLSWLINFGQQVKSSVFIQTFFPNNFIIQSAVSQNYKSFYNQEMEERKKFNYPPFGKLVKLIYSHKNEKKCAFEEASLFKNLLTSLGREVEILRDEKPVKEKQKFFVKIILKFADRATSKIQSFLKTIPDRWAIDMDPESLL